MRSSIASLINSFLEFRSTLRRDSCNLSGNVSSPFFSAKNTTLTAYRLESSLARFKKCRLPFYSYCVLARVQIKNGNILLLLSSLFVSSSMKESQKFIFSRNFPALVTCKTSKFVTKETSLLSPQIPWRLTKLPINFISL